MEDPRAQLLFSSISTSGFLICDLRVRALIEPKFFTGLVCVFSHSRAYAECKGFSGIGHYFQGKIRDLGHSYRDVRSDVVTPINEIGAIQATPV